MSFQGKKNVYSCTECGYQTITIDKDDGTTPFMIQCRNPFKCTGWSRSNFYRVDQDLPPTHEWYRPDEQEIAQLTKPAVIDHVRMGGLLIREIEKDAVQESRPEQIPEPERTHLYDKTGETVLRDQGLQEETPKTKKEVMISGEESKAGPAK
jgi:hypothetical protein